MSKNEMIAKQIAEINRNIRDGVNQWADVMLQAEADEWAVHLKYFPRDIVNATMIFQHICSNVGIKSGHVNEEKAVNFGKRLRELVIEMTGYDPSLVVADMKTDES